MLSKLLPNIYLFNPTCEYAVGNGNASWQPNRLLQKMETDLATLPLFFAQENDFVIVPRIPSEYFVNSLHKIGIQPPRFITSDMLEKNLPERIASLNPWGWSPAVHKRLQSLKNNCSDNFKHSPVFNWKAEYRDLYSKKFARKIQKEITRDYPSVHFIDQFRLTEIATTQADFEHLLKKWGMLMIKAPWSSSGRGLQTIRKTPIHPKVWDKILGIVKDQGYAIVEPYLNKVIDLAYQFKIENGKIQFVGTSNFSTDYKGQYNGNSLNGLPDSLEEEVKTFIAQVPALVIDPLIKILERSELAQNYEGYFGVDTLIFRNEKGALNINPCLEINVRYNMGLLSLYMEQLIVPGKKGIFRTWFKPGTSFKSFCEQMQKENPLQLSGNKIESGFFPVTEICIDTQFGAYILV